MMPDYDEAEEETTTEPGTKAEVNVSREMVERYKELHSIMKEFRATLGPRKEAIFEGVVTGIDMDEVFDLIEVSGGESLTVSGEYEGKSISIMFRTKS